MSTRIEMLNRALLRIGADPIDTEADTGAAVHLRVYDSVLEHVASYPWSFMKTTRRLPQVSLATLHGYAYAYHIPPESIGAIRAVFADAETRVPVTDYDIEEKLLLTSQPQVWVTYMRLGNVARWPGDFREAFTVYLMAELALSIREDRVLRDTLRKDVFGMPSYGGGLLDKAQSADSQQTPGRVVGGGYNPLVDVRS